MSWNDNLDFAATYKLLRHALITKDKDYTKYQKPSRRSKTAVLLICLRNGCRVSEGFDAFHLFLANGCREQTVKVAKRGFKYKKDDKGQRRRANPGGEAEEPVYRLIIIPDEVSNTLPAIETELQSVTHHARRYFDFRPHSLRYAFITYMGKQGVAPQVIAKQTQHSNLSMILNYTTKQEADAVLRNLKI